MGVSVNQSLAIISKDAASNTAQVRYTVQCTTSGESWNGYTQTGTFNIDGISYSSSYTLPQNTTTTVFNKTVTISNASGKTVGASYSFPTTPYYGTQTGNTSVYIDLPLYLNITTFNSSNISLNTFKINWATDAARDWTQYKLNNGSWIDSSTYGETVASDNKSGTFTVGNVSPNTTYSVKIRCRRASNQLWTESGTINVTTKDIAKISSASNFNLGSSANVTITNPAGASTSLNVKIGDTSIKTQSLSTGSNTISFNDTQLDNMYKKFGTGNTITITYVLTTANNANYTNTKTATCTLTGDQKTVRIGINNTTKRAKVFIGVNGQVKRAVVWVGVNGTPKRCI